MLRWCPGGVSASPTGQNRCNTKDFRVIPKPPNPTKRNKIASRAQLLAVSMRLSGTNHMSATAM